MEILTSEDGEVLAGRALGSEWTGPELEADSLERLSRGDVSGWHDLALAYHLQGRARASRKAARRAASAGDPKGWYVVAQHAWSRGQIAKARRAVSAALRDPSPSVIALDVVLRWEESGRANARELEAAAREWDEAVVGLAELRCRQGDQECAVKLLQSAFADGNEMVGTPLGLLLDNLGRTSESMAVYEESWKRGDSHGAYNLALLHEELGEFDRAVHWARCAASGGHRRARRWLSGRRRAAQRVLRNQK